ncbi:MAG TPA: hypothetical protein VJ044_14150, partial [Candidatus Hodarchaeales archaeon]|nr:hypothetical protein [Candidatus Hodarchaeales archaeon]
MKVVIHKGGKGSGHFGHSGRPGEEEKQQDFSDSVIVAFNLEDNEDILKLQESLVPEEYRIDDLHLTLLFVGKMDEVDKDKLLETVQSIADTHAPIRGVFNGYGYFDQRKEFIEEKGGDGSGFHGHAGRPGKVGGSAKSGVTSTEAFKNWFGDSKVVDENGNPRIVYHGTASDFSEFDERYLGEYSDHPSAHFGFYFTNDPATASDFADREGGRVIGAYLKMENPAVMKAEEFAEELDFWKGVKGSRYGGDRYERSAEHFRETREWLISKGYDGLIVEAGETSYPELNHRNYIAFYSTHIKSAYGNVGTFDPDNPDITKEYSEDDLCPVVLFLDSPSLTGFHFSVKVAIQSPEKVSDHGFTPHVTLGYIPHELIDIPS